MRLSKVLVSVLFAAVGFASHAQDDVRGTGLFLEPGIGYQLTESNIDYPAPYANSLATTRGFGAIVRGGIHVWERFFVAADARYFLLRYNDNANNITSSATAWDIAPVVGMQMADYGIRLFGGYVLAGELDPDGANGFDYKFEEATGWRVGVGLKLQQLSVNIEWQRLTYDGSLEQRGGIAAGTTPDLEFNPDGIVASVSFPIEFN